MMPPSFSFWPSGRFSSPVTRGPVVCFAGIYLMTLPLLRSQDVPPEQVASSDVYGPIKPGSIESNGVHEPVTPASIGAEPQGSLLETGRVALHTYVQFSAVYNDNIDISQTNKQSDLVWTLTPGLILGAGDYVQREESWLTIEYAPSFVLFTEHGRDDSIDQEAHLNFEWHPANWTFGVRQSYERQSSPVVEVGNRVEWNLYATRAYVEYEYSPKTSFEVAYDQSIYDYGDPLFSYTTREVSGWANYWITPKVRLSLGGVGGFDDISSNPNQTYQQGAMRFEYNASDSLVFQGLVGAEEREFQGGARNRLNGIFTLGADWQPWDSTSLLLEAYRRDESSLVASNQNYTITGVSATLHQNFGARFTASLTGGFDHSEYYSTDTVANHKSDYDYFYLRPGVEINITPKFTADVFYQLQKNYSSGANAFNNTDMGVNLNYQF